MPRFVIAGLLAAAGVLAALALVPTGAADEETERDNTKALSYLPPGGMLLAQVSTDFDSPEFRALDARIARRLLGTRIAPLLEDAAEDADLTYDREVRPQLGNDLAVAIRWPALSDGQGFVGALQVMDPSALRRVLDGNRFLRFDGDASGARLYRPKETRESFLALEEDMLVAADSERRLRRALARRDSGGGMNDVAFRARLGDLSRDAPIRVVGDVQPLFDRRELRRLRRVPWVRALRTMSATLGASDQEIRAEGVLETDASQIGPGDLPIQLGKPPPALVGSLRQFAGASVNQSQSTVFLLRAARAAFPRSRFVRDVRRLERAYKINFEREVLRQFNGPSATLLAPNGRFAARSAVQDPRRLARTIRRIAPDLGRVIEDLEALESTGLSLLLLFAPDAPISHGVLGRSRVKVERLSGQRDFYRLRGLRRGPGQVYFGLHKRVFVVGSSERRAKEMATAPAQPRPGVSGAGAMLADLGAMREAIKRAGDIDLGRLGQMLGSLEATPARLHGKMTVELR
jgi:hypothetical protein